MRARWVSDSLRRMLTTGASLHECVARALAEDLGAVDLSLAKDVTTALSVPAGRRGRARLFAKADGVLAGVDCAVDAFRTLDPKCELQQQRVDGDRVAPGDTVLEVHGDMHAILAAERTALNFVQRLAGIATLTRAFVDAVSGTGAGVYDTRKTTPGLRMLEKAAVVAGGGQNHRIGLYDQVLLKENHFAFAQPATHEETVRRCVAAHDRPVIAEARTVDEAIAIVRGGAAIVLLDNFAPGEQLQAAVRAVHDAAKQAGHAVLTEASGGVQLQTVRAFAESGVDRISIGALTHSARAVDFSLHVEGVADLQEAK